MSKSTYLRHKQLDHFVGGPSFIRPAVLHVSLHVGDPATSGANECTGNNYGRAAVDNTIANWPAASGGQKANGVAIVFARATLGSGGWGLVTHFGLWDASSGGNFWRGAALIDPQTLAPTSIFVQGGDAPFIPIGFLKLTET